MKNNLSMKANKLITLLLAIAMMSAMLTACADRGEPTTDDGGGNDANTGTITIIDHADREVTLPAEIERIAVCDIFPIPSVLAVFFNSADKIVGMPAPSKTAAENGLLGQIFPGILNAETGYIDGSNINLEELAKLEPDVVFYSASSPDIGEQLTNAGFAAVAISSNKWNYDCIETLNNWIDLLSQMFPESAKTDLVTMRSLEIYQLVQDRIKDIPEKERARAFFLFQYSDTTLLTSGKQFFGQWWADAIGAVNVAEELEQDNSSPVNMEQVYAWNPDLIFMTNFNTYYPDDLYNNTVAGYDWSAVKAVKNQRVYKMPLGMYRSYTPGVDCPITLLWMAKTAYPERFEDIDIIKEAEKYYKEIFGIELSDEQAKSIFEPVQSAGGGFSYQ